MAKTNPFDYTNSINQTKKNLMRNTANDKIAEKEYAPFLTNRALSYHNDTIFYANEMNRRHHLDNLLQYEYLLNTVRPKKRYAKWSKKDSNDGDVLLVKEYYGYNDSKARQALAILSTEQLSIIKTRMHKGGKDG
jgi:hypothetical protein